MDSNERDTLRRVAAVLEGHCLWLNEQGYSHRANVLREMLVELTALTRLPASASTIQAEPAQATAPPVTGKVRHVVSTQRVKEDTEADVAEATSFAIGRIRDQAEGRPWELVAVLSSQVQTAGSNWNTFVTAVGRML
jgi:hypothetical protein